VSQELWVDALWVTLAFASGLLFRKLNLPALIGFLITGILLDVLGLTHGNISTVLHTLADLGVMLLLFTLGLKMQYKTLLKPEIWITPDLSTLFLQFFQQFNNQFIMYILVQHLLH
jgi:Kef-type K+ transport system, predicted NAD-binding component